MKVAIRYILVFLLLTANAAFAQSFITKVSSKSIGKNDLLEVQYVAENIELSDFQLPKFPGWLVQSGPNFSSNRVQTGTLVKQQIIYSVMLQPTRAGKLSVPSATITIDKHNSRQSNTVTIDVKPIDHVAGNAQNQPAAVQPGIDDMEPDEENFVKDQVLRKGENALNKIKNNLLVKLDVTKTTCYAGEPIIATYKLCTRLRSQSKVVKQPEFSGCTVTELTTDQSVPKRERINGKLYNVYVIRRVQLIPLQPGELVLPQASVENTVGFYREEDINYRDRFYDPGTPSVVEHQVTLGNAAATIHIKALPLPQPEGFDGAVGKFNLQVSRPDKPLSTNTNTSFLLAVEGTGNLQQMKAPAISWPSGIEAFEPKDLEETDKTSSPLRVRKTFTYPFVINNKGNYTIPPISFCYFDPSTSRYETISTHAVTFEAKKGNKIVLPNASFLNDSDFQTRLYILIVVGFVAIVAGLYWFNKKQSKPVAPEKISEQIPIPEPATNSGYDTAQWVHYVRELNPIEDDHFYKQLRRFIISYLTTKFKIAEDDIPKLGERYPAENATFTSLQILLQNCSLGMYTPVFDAEEAMQHRLHAMELLGKLERI